jgi:lipopolysaccharide heptosyltransferase I
MDKFLIIRLSSLGDIIHTLPAFSALRESYPEAEIRWLVEDKGKEILDFVPGLDDIFVVHSRASRKGLKETLKELRQLRKKIKDKKQIALDFQGLIKSAFFSSLSGAKVRLGFSRSNLKESQARFFYTKKLPEVSEKDHVIYKNLELLTMVGVDEKKIHFPLNIPEEYKETMNKKLKSFGYEGQKLIIMNVGAAWETKRWFSEGWIELSKWIISEKSDSFPLLLWGNEIEKELAESIKTETSISVAPPLSLKEVLSLIQMSSLVISGDTFALQAACAFSVPVVGLFGPTNPKRNGPFDPKDKVAFHEITCSYCYKRKCPSLECLRKITPEEVIELCSERLR